MYYTKLDLGESLFILLLFEVIGVIFILKKPQSVQNSLLRSIRQAPRFLLNSVIAKDFAKDSVIAKDHQVHKLHN